MLKSVRAPEKVYGLVLWVVSVVFAGFIIGLGNLVIGDLPQVTTEISPEQFANGPRTQAIGAELRQIAARRGAIDDKLQIAKLQLEQAHRSSQSATDTFEAWIQTRNATTNPRQDPEVLARTHSLEALKGNERTIQADIDALDSERLPLDQRESALQVEQNNLREAAYPAYQAKQFAQELRVFLLRLAITLPMLLVATWLVVKKRKSDTWPLARGFVLAAVFVFFVELVPYLPSYGGYVRYGVGIVLTFAAGMFLIRNMRAYLANRLAVEAQAEAERRKLVSHDEAFRKMAAKQCPGCDRPIATMEGSESNFCVHCGMTLYDHCHSCNTRKMAFFRFCMACGTPAQAETGEISATPA